MSQGRTLYCYNTRALLWGLIFYAAVVTTSTQCIWSDPHRDVATGTVLIKVLQWCCFLIKCERLPDEDTSLMVNSKWWANSAIHHNHIPKSEGQSQENTNRESKYLLVCWSARSSHCSHRVNWIRFLCFLSWNRSNWLTSLSLGGKQQPHDVDARERARGREPGLRERRRSPLSLSGGGPFPAPPGLHASLLTTQGKDSVVGLPVCPLWRGLGRKIWATPSAQERNCANSKHCHMEIWYYPKIVENVCGMKGRGH